MCELKIAVIGCGFIGTLHVENLKRIPNVKVVALVDGDLAKAKQKAKELGVSKYYDDYRELLADCDVDVIHNCTPNHLHFEVSKAAILAGKHVVSEKPLTLTSEEAEELTKLAEEQGVVTAVNHLYRFYPMVQQMRSLINNGELGQIYSWRATYLQDWMLNDDAYNWRVDPLLGGRSRALADIGSHICDLVQHLSGQRIVKVYANLQTFLEQRKATSSTPTFSAASDEKPKGSLKSVKTEDYATVIFHLEDGTIGTFTVSQMVAGRKNQLKMEVDGSKKSLSWNQERPDELWIGHKDKANEILLGDPSLLSPEARKFARYPGGHNEGYADALANLFANVYHLILNEGSTEINFPQFQEGWYQMKLIDAMLESDETGKFVTLCARN